MQRLSDRITADELASVNLAVEQAESRVQVEIIPVIAACSGRYDRAEDVAGLWCGLLLLAAVWSVWPLPTERGSWSTTSDVWQLLAFSAAVVAGFIAGAIIISRVDSVRRLFTPRSEMRAEVQQRSRAVFFDQRVHHTTARAGILIYISLMQRQAEIIVDQAVYNVLGQSGIDELCTDLTQKLRAEQATAALCGTIGQIAVALSPHLPRQAGAGNERADALVLLD